MSVIEQLRIKLAGLKDRESRLRLRIDGNARLICQGLTPALVPADEIEVPLLDEQWDELKAAWAELQVVKNDIARVERELR